MLLSADILPQNTMYNNIRYDEPQKLGGLQPPSPPLVYTLAVTLKEVYICDVFFPVFECVMVLYLHICLQPGLSKCSYR